MTTTARTAHADQLHSTVRDARDCDALAPCADCAAKTAEVRAARKQARVDAVVAAKVAASRVAEGEKIDA